MSVGQKVKLHNTAGPVGTVVEVYETLDIARDAARQLNDYVQRTTGTRPFYAYQPK